MKRNTSENLGLVDNKYQGGDPRTGRNPSVIDANTFESITEEIQNLQTKGGATPKEKNNQIAEAVPFIGRKTLELSGSENALKVADTNIGVLSDGITFEVIGKASNTGPVTLQINSLEIKEVSKDGVNKLTNGDISTGGRYTLRYDISIDKFLIFGEKTNVIDNLLSHSSVQGLAANQGRVLDDKVVNLTHTHTTDFGYLDRKIKVIEGSTVVGVEDNLTSTSATNSLSANQGRILNIKIGEIDGGGGTGNVDIVDNLSSSDPDKALSANQGRILDQKIVDADGTVVNSFDKEIIPGSPAEPATQEIPGVTGTPAIPEEVIEVTNESSWNTRIPSSASTREETPGSFRVGSDGASVILIFADSTRPSRDGIAVPSLKDFANFSSNRENRFLVFSNRQGSLNGEIRIPVNDLYEVGGYQQNNGNWVALINIKNSLESKYSNIFLVDSSGRYVNSFDLSTQVITAAVPKVNPVPSIPAQPEVLAVPEQINDINIQPIESIKVDNYTTDSKLITDIDFKEVKDKVTTLNSHKTEIIPAIPAKPAEPAVPAKPEVIGQPEILPIPEKVIATNTKLFAASASAVTDFTNGRYFYTSRENNTLIAINLGYASYNKSIKIIEFINETENRENRYIVFSNRKPPRNRTNTIPPGALTGEIRVPVDDVNAFKEGFAGDTEKLVLTFANTEKYSGKLLISPYPESIQTVTFDFSTQVITPASPGRQGIPSMPAQPEIPAKPAEPAVPEKINEIIKPIESIEVDNYTPDSKLITDVDFEEVKDKIATLEGKTVEVVDNLNSNSSTNALSSNQGRILKGNILSNTNEINEVDTRVTVLEEGGSGGEGVGGGTHIFKNLTWEDSSETFEIIEPNSGVTSPNKIEVRKIPEDSKGHTELVLLTLLQDVPITEYAFLSTINSNTVIQFRSADKVLHGTNVSVLTEGALNGLTPYAFIYKASWTSSVVDFFSAVGDEVTIRISNDGEFVSSIDIGTDPDDLTTNKIVGDILANQKPTEKGFEITSNLLVNAPGDATVVITGSTGPAYRFDGGLPEIIDPSKNYYIYANNNLYVIFRFRLDSNSSTGTFDLYKYSEKFKDPKVSKENVLSTGNTVKILTEGGLVSYTSEPDLEENVAVFYKKNSSGEVDQNTIPLLLELPEGGGNNVEIINNLTSESITHALASNQGRILNNKIGEVDSKVDTNASEISGVNTKITDLESKVDTNTEKITSNDGDITGLGDRIDTLDSKVNTNISSISENESSISGIDTRVSTLENGNNPSQPPTKKGIDITSNSLVDAFTIQINRTAGNTYYWNSGLPIAIASGGLYYFTKNNITYVLTEIKDDRGSVFDPGNHESGSFKLYKYYEEFHEPKTLITGVLTNGESITLKKIGGLVKYNSVPDLEGNVAVFYKKNSSDEVDQNVLPLLVELPAGSGGSSSNIEIVNNLTSESITEALASNQGRILNLKITDLSTKVNTNISDISENENSISGIDTRVSTLESAGNKKGTVLNSFNITNQKSFGNITSALLTLADGRYYSGFSRTGYLYIQIFLGYSSQSEARAVADAINETEDRENRYIVFSNRQGGLNGEIKVPLTALQRSGAVEYPAGIWRIALDFIDPSLYFDNVLKNSSDEYVTSFDFSIIHIIPIESIEVNNYTTDSKLITDIGGGGGSTLNSFDTEVVSPAVPEVSTQTYNYTFDTFIFSDVFDALTDKGFYYGFGYGLRSIYFGYSSQETAQAIKTFVDSTDNRDGKFLEFGNRIGPSGTLTGSMRVSINDINSPTVRQLGSGVWLLYFSFKDRNKYGNNLLKTSIGGSTYNINSFNLSTVNITTPAVPEITRDIEIQQIDSIKVANYSDGSKLVTNTDFKEKTDSLEYKANSLIRGLNLLKYQVDSSSSSWNKIYGDDDPNVFTTADGQQYNLSIGGVNYNWNDFSELSFVFYSLFKRANRSGDPFIGSRITYNLVINNIIPYPSSPSYYHPYGIRVELINTTLDNEGGKIYISFSNTNKNQFFITGDSYTTLGKSYYLSAVQSIYAK